MSCAGTPISTAEGEGSQPEPVLAPTSLTCTHSLNSHVYPDVGTTIIPILQIEKLRQRQISNLLKATYT